MGVDEVLDRQRCYLADGVDDLLRELRVGSIHHEDTIGAHEDADTTACRVWMQRVGIRRPAQCVEIWGHFLGLYLRLVEVDALCRCGDCHHQERTDREADEHIPGNAGDV
jgi:hypothetical protein